MKIKINTYNTLIRRCRFVLTCWVFINSPSLLITWFLWKVGATNGGSTSGARESSDSTPATHIKARTTFPSSPTKPSHNHFLNRWQQHRHRHSPLLHFAHQRRRRLLLQKGPFRLLRLAPWSPSWRTRRWIRWPSLQKHRFGIIINCLYSIFFLKKEIMIKFIYFVQVNTQAPSNVIDCSDRKNSKYYVVVVQVALVYFILFWVNT